MPRKIDKSRQDNVDPAALQQAASDTPIRAVSGRRVFEAAVLEADLPVVVDFWAPACQPCLKLGAMLAELAPLYVSRLRFVKVNLAESANAWAGEHYDITNIPVLMPFVDGAIVEGEELVGLCSRAALVKWLDRLAAPWTAAPRTL